MTDDYLIRKNFLEEQLILLQERDQVLEEMEEKLYEMRSIAEYAVEQKLPPAELDRMSHQLDELQGEILALGKQLDAVVH